MSHRQPVVLPSTQLQIVISVRSHDPGTQSSLTHFMWHTKTVFLCQVNIDANQHFSIVI